MPVDTMSGLREAANTANTSVAVNSSAQPFRRAQAKATARAANTANDAVAYRQMLATLVRDIQQSGAVTVTTWQSEATTEPVVLIAVYATRKCRKCGNLYPHNSVCGICDNRAPTY